MRRISAVMPDHILSGLSCFLGLKPLKVRMTGEKVL